MKIVVKHVDNLKSSHNKEKEPIPEYLVYLMTEDNIPVVCSHAYGEEKKDLEVLYIQWDHGIDADGGDEGGNITFTLPVHEVSYSEFKNNVLRNQPTYVGN